AQVSAVVAGAFDAAFVVNVEVLGIAGVNHGGVEREPFAARHGDALGAQVHGGDTAHAARIGDVRDAALDGGADGDDGFTFEHDRFGDAAGEGVAHFVGGGGERGLELHTYGGAHRE